MLGTVVCDALMRHCLSDEIEVQHECKLQCPHTFIDTHSSATAEDRRYCANLTYPNADDHISQRTVAEVALPARRGESVENFPRLEGLLSGRSTLKSCTSCCSSAPGYSAVDGMTDVIFVDEDQKAQ